MGGYIGARAGTISATVANVQDVTATDTTPEVTIVNTTHEDTDGGREGKVIFKGQQSGGEETTLAEIQGSHDGTADDEKGDLIFKTNDGSDGASPTERLRIDSAGFVGINESAPSGILHVKGTSVAHGKVIVEAGGSGGSANNNFVEFNKHDGTKLAEIEVGESVTNGGDIVLKTTPSGGSATERVRIDNAGKNTFTTTSAGASTNPLVLHNASSSANTDVRMLLAPCTTAADRPVILAATNNGSNVCHFTVSTPNGGTPAERLRIDGAGNVFINTLNDMGGILNTSHADGVAIGSANNATYYRRIYGTAGANLDLKFWNGSNEGMLNNAGAWVNASDVSLKENIADIEYGIDTVKSLKPRKYTMKEGGNSEIGFVAQEMETVIPEIVTTSENPDGDEIKGISYGQLTSVLTKALQEAITKIETLEAQNTTQATQIADLITRVTALEAE